MISIYICVRMGTCVLWISNTSHILSISSCGRGGGWGKGREGEEKWQSACIPNYRYVIQATTADSKRGWAEAPPSPQLWQLKICSLLWIKLRIQMRVMAADGDTRVLSLPNMPHNDSYHIWRDVVFLVDCSSPNPWNLLGTSQWQERVSPL